MSKRLEQGFEAGASGSITTSARNMQTAFKSLYQELQAKFNQDQEDLQQWQVETHGKMEEIANST